MIDVILGVALLLVTIVLLGAIYLLFKRSQQPAEQATAQLLKADLQALNEGMERLKDGMHDRMERNQTAMQSSLQKQLSESAKIITEVTNRLTKLDETNRRVVDVATELKTLQNVLQNPKQRGVLGEYFLQSVLENVLPPDRFKLQYKLGKGDDGRDLICDAVIFLDKNKVLPIDSKFSLENYNRFVESNDKAQQESLVKLIRSDLKNRIDETASIFSPKRARWILLSCSSRAKPCTTISSSTKWVHYWPIRAI